MTKLDDICYKKPFLKEVIVKIDFPSPVDIFSDKLDTSISKIALSRFPIAEPQKIKSQELQFTDTKLTTNEREINQWGYHGKNREKSLVISPMSIFQTTTDYSSFEDFKSDFFSVIEAVLKIQSDLPVSRIGLRYINVIEPAKTKNPLDWSEYINEELLGNFTFKNKLDHLSRTFNILEYNIQPTNLKFQYGIPNPDYPAVIKRKQFVLDLDSVQMGSFDLNEVQKLVEDSHCLIQEFFELSITEALRKLMKAKPDARK